MNAVQAIAEHGKGLAIDYYLPYRLTAGRIETSEMFAVNGKRKIFPR